MSELAKKTGRALGWVIGIGLLYYACSPKSTEWVMSQETTAGGYAIIAKEYSALSAESQALVRSRNDKGYLTRKDVSDILMTMTGDRGAIQVYPAPDFGDPEEGTTSVLWRSLIGERSTYKSKAVLNELLAES
jgi:hypothetical protein